MLDTGTVYFLLGLKHLFSKKTFSVESHNNTIEAENYATSADMADCRALRKVLDNMAVFIDERQTDNMIYLLYNLSSTM